MSNSYMHGGGHACGMTVVRSYDDTGKIVSDSAGSLYSGPVCYNSRGVRTGGNVENPPHESGFSHICGYGEDGSIYEWTDGTFTKNGVIVEDPRRKDTNMSTENETVVLTLPTEVGSDKRVSVGGLLFEKRGMRWQRVGGTTRYNWGELFQLDGGKVTVLPSTPAVAVVTDALTEAGVYNAPAHAVKIVEALNASTKVDLVARTYKVGDKVSQEDASKVEADQNITQVIDRDGDVWSRQRDGKWALREQVNEQATGEYGRLAIYAPLTIKTVK